MDEQADLCQNIGLPSESEVQTFKVLINPTSSGTKQLPYHK